jgi:hypothetical protein
VWRGHVTPADASACFVNLSSEAAAAEWLRQRLCDDPQPPFLLAYVNRVRTLSQTVFSRIVAAGFGVAHVPWTVFRGTAAALGDGADAPEGARVLVLTRLPRGRCDGGDDAADGLCAACTALLDAACTALADQVFPGLYASLNLGSSEEWEAPLCDDD